MSRASAKKKGRRRARPAGGARSAAAQETRAQRAERRAQARADPPATPPPQRRPPRLEERDGVTRPDAVWAPFPLTEIGMAVGIVLFVAGFAAASPWLLTIGIGVLAVVVSELCLREHFAGFRSHSLLLALLAVTVAHMLVVVLVSGDWRGPLVLVVDLALVGALAWWLRRRFVAARARAQRRAAR